MAELSKVLNLDSSLISKIFKIESSNVSKICGLDWPTGAGGGDRGIFGGGAEDINSKNVIEYVTITSLGNVSDFGDLPGTRTWLSATSNGASDRGVFGGGNSNVIEYVTISSTGNTSDFGDLTQGRQETSATSNGTGNIGVFGGGQGPGGVDKVNIMDYVTITSLGNASDFGDLNADICRIAATSNLNNNMGVFGGGVDDSVVKYNVLQYIQINSTSNSSDFGDLTEAKCESSATSNGTEDRGVWGGGYAAARVNTMEYITISSLGNASDFGDFSSEAKNSLAATSNGS